MKKSILLVILAAALYGSAQSQTINQNAWKSEQKNVGYVNLGYDFGMTTQVGYGRAIHVLTKRVLLTTELSVPMGNKVLDDFKVRYGLQAVVAKFGHFAVSARALGIVRRHETKLVTMVGVGIEPAAVIGYYRPKWFLSGEFGFDKPITTHLTHSERMRQDFPAITNGWYTAAGGNYFYGITVGRSISDSIDLSLRLGSVDAQGNDKDPVLPYYAQIGVVKKF